MDAKGSVSFNVVYKEFLVDIHVWNAVFESPDYLCVKTDQTSVQFCHHLFFKGQILRVLKAKHRCLETIQTIHCAKIRLAKVKYL